jgi:hypothetical protein
MIMIVFRQLVPAQSSLKYSASLRPALVVGSLLAIIGSEESV